jgi:ABC-2 type transport system permease protein
MSTSTPSAGPSYWRVVAEREVTTQLKSRAFQITAAILVLSIVGMIVLSSLLQGREQTREVAVVDDVAAAAVGQAASIADDLDGDLTVEATTYDDAAAAETAVREGDVDAVLLPEAQGGYELLGDDGVDATLAQAVTSALTSQVTAANAAELDVDLEALGDGAQVQQRLLDPGSDDAGLRQVASFVFVLLFYLTALTFGMTIAGSVTQEKESRVVEILAAAVPIRALLWGKIIGTSVLAIGQTVVLAAVGVVALAVTGNTDWLGVVGPAIAWYVAFFVLGFVALASVWSVAGSLASRQQDLGGTTAPLQIILFAPYIVAVTAGEGVRTVVSMLPIVSTMLMPARLAEGDVPLWQLGVAVATTTVAAVLLVRVGARIYEQTLLRTGNRIGFGAALRSARDDADAGDGRDPAGVTAP